MDRRTRFAQVDRSRTPQGFDSDPNLALVEIEGGAVLDCAYVSRVFPLGAAEAIEATEAWYRDLESVPGGRRLIGGRKLLLQPRFAPTDSDSQLLRRLRGTLWVGWWWPVRIELELVWYSPLASEIALRPSTLRWPVGMERYRQDAARAVDGIVAAITTGVLVD
jgi:hypothetical protein